MFDRLLLVNLVGHIRINGLIVLTDTRWRTLLLKPLGSLLFDFLSLFHLRPPSQVCQLIRINIWFYCLFILFENLLIILLRFFIDLFIVFDIHLFRNRNFERLIECRGRIFVLFFHYLLTGIFCYVVIWAFIISTVLVGIDLLVRRYCFNIFKVFNISQCCIIYSSLCFIGLSRGWLLFLTKRKWILLWPSGCLLLLLILVLSNDSLLFILFSKGFKILRILFITLIFFVFFVICVILFLISNWFLLICLIFELSFIFSYLVLLNLFLVFHFGYFENQIFENFN